MADDKREAFENWAKNEGLGPLNRAEEVTDCGGYISASVGIAYEAYRAGAADAHAAVADLLVDEAKQSAYAAELLSAIRALAEKERGQP